MLSYFGQLIKYSGIYGDARRRGSGENQGIYEIFEGKIRC
jgi:hypothetical protein